MSTTIEISRCAVCPSFCECDERWDCWDFCECGPWEVCECDPLETCECGPGERCRLCTF